MEQLLTMFMDRKMEVTSGADTKRRQEEDKKPKFKMGSLIKNFYSKWQLLTEDLGDDRTRGWFMTNSPIPIIVVIFVYYQFIKRIGPEFMKDRKPFNLDKIIQIYNVLQVVMCGWLTYESFRITYGPYGSYNWNCQPIDPSSSPLAVKVATLTWIYYMIKIIDLLDTVFFVLRKKFNQASFLHVYHHIGTLVLGYIGTKYYPDGQGFVLIPLNSFVHCFMYFYYFLTNYNQEYKKKIWWKKYITQLQLVQFLILMVQMGKVLIMPSCDYPLTPVLLFLPQNVFIFILFWNFYRQTYLKPSQTLKTS